jgi:hypothetical protein
MAVTSKHGGRRKNQTGRPRHDNPKTVQVKTRFTPEEITCIDKQRQPGESRAACVRRLVMEIVRIKEKTMNKKVVVNEEVLEELIRRWTGSEINLIHEFSGDITASHIVGVLTSGSMAKE